MAIPTVTALDPASGPAGTLVTITGTGFTEDTSAVMFGAVSAGTRFSVVSGTQMTAYAPAGTGTVAVKVTTPGGAGTVGSNFTYDAYVGPPAGGGGSAPTVTSVTPSTAVDNDGGDAVVVAGTGFTTTTAVFFGTALAQFAVTSDTALAVTTPAGSGVVDVTVVSAYGISANTAADNFTYPVGLIPTITSFTPTSAGEMALLTITGTNFWTAAGLVVVTGVTFTGAGATEIPTVFRAESATSLKVYVPEGAVTGVIKVYSEAGSATSASFTCLGTVYGVIQTSANGKNTIHYDTNPPGTAANLAGDIWYQYGTVTPPGGSAHNNCVTHQYTGTGGTGWQEVALSNLVVTSLDAGAITAGTISVAIALTSATITAGVIRTAASGLRIEITGTDNDKISLYTGSGTQAAEIQIAASKWLYIKSPVDPTYGYSAIIMSPGTVSSAAGISLSGDVAVQGNLSVLAKIVPQTDFASGTSNDGIFCQDSYATTKRCKIYYNSSSKRFGVYDDAGNAHYVAVS